MLTLKNLSLTASDAQGRTDIVKNVSLDVEDGKFLVITGPNGGGKTTLAKLIMGLATPTGGQILLDGEDITPLSITDRARRGISYSFQQPPRFKGITVHDLLLLAAGQEKLSKDKCCAYLTKVGLCANDYLDSEVDEHTVEVYISRLREKFRDNGDFELRTIRGFGYMGMLREDEDAQS